MTLGAAWLAELVGALEANPDLAARLRRALNDARDDDVIDAAKSGLSVREFRAAIKSGKLVGSKAGRRYVCTRAALADYLARGVEPRRRPRASTPSATASSEAPEAGSPADRALARAMRSGALVAVRGGKR